MKRNDIKKLLRETAGYAIRPAFKQELREELLQQFREELNMKTPYEQGRAQGTWTRDELLERGETPEECLEQQEAVYQEAMSEVIPSLYKRSPELGKEYAELHEGIIVSTRESLRAMM